MSRLGALLWLGTLALLGAGCGGGGARPVSVRAPEAAPARAAAASPVPVAVGPETARLHAAIRASLAPAPPWWLAPSSEPSPAPASYPPLPPLVRSAGESIRSGGRADEPRLPPETVQRVVRQSSGRFVGCLRRGLADDPRARGRVVVRFTIGPDGSVVRAEEELATLADREARQCLLSSFFELRFPAPPERSLTVRYPLAISSTAERPLDELHDARRTAEPPPPGFAEAMREGRRVVGPAGVAPSVDAPLAPAARSCAVDDPMCGEL